MSRIRRILSRINRAATTISAAIPISAIFSSSLSASSKDDPVAAANRFHTGVFIAYVVILLLAALFQWWAWSTGNRLQDAIRANSDARIAEAKEATVKLEKDNLTLRRDLNAEVGKVAILQRDASDAKAAQQKVEIELTKQGADLSRQKELTAKAEKEVFELRERLQPRRISPVQKTRLVEMLSRMPKGAVTVISVMGDRESQDFANDIVAVLLAAGWPVPSPAAQAMYSGSHPVGIGIIVRDAKAAPPYAGALQQAFFAVGIPLVGAENATYEEGRINLIVGVKP